MKIYDFIECIVILMFLIYLEFGQERSEPLSDQSADNVLKKIEGLVKQ